ncbi:MAG: phage BR0599 family protein [Amphiplicatus sp.]
MATCAAKFSNEVNFRGFHLMPGNDFAVSYPLHREKNDGGRRS